MDVICIDSFFPREVVEFNLKNKIEVPKQDGMYTIRGIINTVDGEVGVWLDQIKNPKVTIKHPILQLANVEPSFNIDRFRKIDGGEITSDEVKEMAKDTANVRV